MKLYVGNLSYDVTENDLIDLFSKHGQAMVKLIVDRDSGRSKGFAFVEYDSEDKAESAISEFDGLDLKGRAIRVSKAKPREEGGGGGRRFGGGGGGGGGRRFGGGGGGGGRRFGGGGGGGGRGGNRGDRGDNGPAF